jgi:multimeric flavodoxin WrbA
MQVLILSGSRNRRGQTARAIKAIQKGIVEGKGESEVVFLTEVRRTAIYAKMLAR